MSKPLRDEKLKRKIRKKTREWKFLIEDKEDFEDLFEFYEAELNKALADLHHHADVSLPEKVNSSLPLLDSRGSYDDEGIFDISESVSSSNPLWAKNLYKQIAIHTHPDKLLGLDIDELERIQREKIFKEATQSLQNKSYEDLIYNAHKLNLDIGIENEEYLKILEKSIEEITREVSSKKALVPWSWGSLEGSPNLRCELLYFIWSGIGEKSPPKDIVLSYINALENDTLEEWKIEYPKYELT